MTVALYIFFKEDDLGASIAVSKLQKRFKTCTSKIDVICCKEEIIEYIINNLENV